MNKERKVASLVLNAELTASQLIAVLEKEIEEAYKGGYDQAAQDITTKLQDLIPNRASTVPDARVQGAWRDAANVALSHLNKFSK